MIESSLPPYFRPSSGGVPLANRRLIRSTVVTGSVLSGSSSIFTTSIPLPPLRHNTLLQLDQIWASVFSTSGNVTTPPLISSISLTLVTQFSPGWQLPFIPPTSLQVRNANHPQQICSIPTYLSSDELWQWAVANAGLPAPAVPDVSSSINYVIGFSNPDTVDHTMVVQMGCAIRIVEGIENG